MTAFGWATVFAVGKFVLFGLAAYAVWKILTRKSSPAFYALFGVMALGIIAVGLALYTFQGPAQVAALVLAVLAASVSLIFYNLKELIGAMGELMAHLFASVDVLPLVAAGIFDVAGGIFLMALAVGALGIAAVASLAAVALLFAATTGLGAVFAGIGILGGGLMLKHLAKDIASIGAGMLQFGAGLGKISSVAGMISNLSGDGFIAINSDGGNTSAVIGSGEIMENFVDGKMTVDVKMPEISMPEITVIVNVDKDGGVSVEKKVANA